MYILYNRNKMRRMKALTTFSNYIVCVYFVNVFFILFPNSYIVIDIDCICSYTLYITKSKTVQQDINLTR